MDVDWPVSLPATGLVRRPGRCPRSFYATQPTAQGAGAGRAPVMQGAAGFGRWQGETPGRLAAHAVEADRASGCALSALTPAVPVLIIGLQDADKIGHAGSVPVFGHNRNPSIGPGLAPLPNPQ
jgi:hypothetical protein